MEPLVALVATLVGYGIGSISFARIVSMFVAPHKDITQTEYKLSQSEAKMMVGTVNATAVSIHLGPRFGFLTVVLDMLKITLPTLVFRHLYPTQSYFLIVAVAGMVGHNWPVFYGFKGGSGLSAVYGGMFAIDWIGVFATALGGMAFGLFIVRDLVVAYLAGIWFTIPWLWFRTHDVGHLAYAIAVNIILVLAMIPQIRGYLQLRRQGIGGDVSEVMRLTGMGRGLYKMGKRFGVFKDQSAS